VTRNTAKKFEKQSVNYADIENISEDVDDSSDFNDLRVDQLKIALNLISPDEKMILLLKYQDNLTFKEIESVLGVGQSAVKIRIKRAKAKLLTVYDNNSN